MISYKLCSIPFLGSIVHECIYINGDLLEDVGMVDSCKFVAASLAEAVCLGLGACRGGCVWGR